MQRFPVGLRVDRDGGDPLLAAGADHPRGDLSAVGDQDLPDGGHAPLIIEGSEAFTMDVVTPPLLADVLIGARFFGKLPAFLRRRLTLAEARAILEVRLERRELDFLALAKRAIYGNPQSPYRRLLSVAGCEYGDLERSVTRDGVDAALGTLLRHGVYLTVDEYKGRRPIRRGSVTIAFDPLQLRNPASACHVPVRTSGSRGARMPVAIDLTFIRDGAVNVLLWLSGRDALDAVTAHWQVPGTGSMARLLEYATFSQPARWFSPVDLSASELAPIHRWSTTALHVGSRLAGVPLPRPEHVPFDDPMPVVRWMTDVLRSGRTPHLHTWPSAAVRLARAATESGLDLAGAQFTIVGEPITDARLAVVRRSGAQSWPRYGSVETAGIGYGCVAPAHSDEVHLLHDFLAVIQARAGGDDVDMPPSGLLVSTLRPTAPLVLLNVSLGDQATLSSRSCGCPLEKLGWATHLHTVRSYEKLTAGGVTFFDTDVIRVLDEILPSRFGGAPTDYQLVEDETVDGRPRLRLLVRPEVGPLDPQAVADAFLDGIGNGAQGGRLMALRWRTEVILRVERRAPLTTPSGKILHLHLSATRPV